MIVYQPILETSEAELVDLGAPENLGGRVLEGAPKISARIDFNDRGMMAGIFEPTTGKVEVRFPFTEHATIVEGEVRITDESGQTRLYRPGDSYFIKQGQVLIWDVRRERVRKSFFNIARP